MHPVRRSYLELHLAVLLLGFTAILGGLIQLSALALVWWRVLITTLSLAPLMNSNRLWRDSSPGAVPRFAGIGVLVALHWLTFYGAIKLANASIALVAFATTSFFTALIEPLIMRHKSNWHEIGLGVLIVPGMILVVRNIDLSMLLGLSVGLLSALLAAVFSSLNKKLIAWSDELTITFLELGAAWIFLSAVIPVFYLSTGESISNMWPSPSDWVYLLILSLLCTTLAYVMTLRALRNLSAFAANLTINMEPVYGIVLAWAILGENKELSPGFYLGVAIILAAVFCHPLLKKLYANY
jgi:drug/metabolite transporter (DMT)-like permease